MKHFLLPMLLLAAVAHGHDIQGVLVRAGDSAAIPRSTIPFDGFNKTPTGRLYTLWIAPDGALVFHLEKPWDPVAFTTGGGDRRFRLWIVEAPRRLALPDGFETVDADKIGGVPGVEELTGHIVIDWRSDNDYTIELDVKGAKGRFAFRGWLFGNPKNVAAEDAPRSP